MITGKEERQHFISGAIYNFLDQSDKYKHLLVINHGNYSIEEKTSLAKNYNITEIRTQETNLGKLRNIALNYIPESSLFCPWDDDDIRDRHFLLYLRHKLFFPYSAVFLKNRYEINLNNNFCFKSTFQDGMPVFLAFKHKDWLYLEVERLEDVQLKKDLNKLKKLYLIDDNFPHLYIRTIHNWNTSPYVKKDKSKIVNYSTKSNYHEYSVSQVQKAKIKDKIYQQLIIFNKKN